MGKIVYRKLPWEVLSAIDSLGRISISHIIEILALITQLTKYTTDLYPFSFAIIASDVGALADDEIEEECELVSPTLD